MNYEPFTSIKNPTLAHFRHFSSLFAYFPSTSVENPLQISYFLCKTNPIQTQFKPNSNPIAERVKMMQSMYLQWIMKKNAYMGYKKTKPKQTQFPQRAKLMQSLYLQRIMKINADMGSEKTNPNKPNFKCPQTHQRSGKKKWPHELFLGLSCRKGYTIWEIPV